MRPLLIALTAVETLLALSLLLYRLTRRVYPGFDRWTVAESLQAGGYLLLTLRGFIPDLISVFGGNVVFPFAVVIRLDGVRRFFRLPPMARGWYALPAVALALLSLGRYVPNAMAWHGAVTSLATAIPALVMAALIWRARPEKRWIFQAAIAGALGFLGLLLAVRGAALLAVLGSARYDWLAGASPEVGAFIAIMVGHVAVTLGFLMLNAERIEHDLVQTEASLTATVRDLQRALGEVQTLSGLLPICANCKRIRDDAGTWTRVEEYIGRHTEAQFSHGICPECARTLYPEMEMEE